MGAFKLPTGTVMSPMGAFTSSTPFAEVLNVTLPRVGALLPFLMLVLILVFRPRGLMGTRDT